MNIQDTRPSEFHRVSKWLDSNPEHGKVDIYGLSGYGGIGKSFLLRHVLDHIRPTGKGFLSIIADGSDPSILGNLIGIYDHSLAPRSVPRGKKNYDYFPHSRRLALEYAKLERDVNDEINKMTSADDVKAAAKWIFRGGSLLNKTVPKSKEYVDFEALQKLGVDKRFEEAVDLLDHLKPLDSSSWLPGPVKDITGITYRERLKTDLYRLASDEWVADLCAILNRYRRNDRYKLTHSPIIGLDRLLLVIDDFEILGKTIIEFMTTALIPALEGTNFHTTLIFVGRDDIADAHVAFQHHLSHLVKDRLRLEKFTDNVAQGMFLEAGYSQEELGQLMIESHGYPFLVNLLCEAKGSSVSFYQQFFERTTRWMGLTERSWVLPLCYLERITEESISHMLPGVSASAVIEWFKHEASLRDPNANWYVIAPYIRRTLIEFHKREIGTKRSDELIVKGKVASDQA
jgi:hypothetical protein